MLCLLINLLRQPGGGNICPLFNRNVLTMRQNTSTPPKLREDYYTSCMHGLDDIGWDHGFAFTSYGTRLGTRVSDPELLEPLQARLPLKSQITGETIVDRVFSVMAMKKSKIGGHRYNLYWDHMLFGKELTLDDMLDRFDAISSLAVAELSDEKLFVHAGVVEWQGRAILIPGKSHSGKTTLVAELVKQGATYYSDEFAVIDEQGYVAAYPKPLSMREPGLLKQKDVTVEDLGGKAGESRLPVGLVVVSQYKKRARWKPQPLSPGIGLLSLLENTHSAQRAPGRAMQTLQRIVSNARIVNSFRGEARRVAPKVLSEVSQAIES